MRALVLERPGEPPYFDLKKVDMPMPAENEICVKVHAASLNPIDVKTAQGGGLYARLQSHEPLILGWDVAGVVVWKGDGVKSFNVGDRVFGMVRFPGMAGTLATYCCVPAAEVAPIPDSISYIEAAAACLAALTAYQALFIHTKPDKKGKHVLVHAGAGGVGHFALQLAKYQGASVITTCSTPNQVFVMQYGADKVIDYTNTKFDEVLNNVDLVVDTIGFEYIERSLKILHPEGILVTLPSVSSHLLPGLLEKYHRKGVFFRVEPNGHHMQILAQWLQAGILRSHVSEVFSLENAPSAFQKLGQGHVQGKLVIQLQS